MKYSLYTNSPWGFSVTIYKEKQENIVNKNALSSVRLACLEMSFVVKGAGAVILLFRLEYKRVLYVIM